jgi:transcriptional regulator with XRE-family HTH domain
VRGHNTVSYREQVPALLAERGMRPSHLADLIGVGRPHMSKVLNARQYKRPSVEMCVRTARALGLPDDYFPEYRLGVVVQALHGDQAVCDRVYRTLRRAGDLSPPGED